MYQTPPGMNFFPGIKKRKICVWKEMDTDQFAAQPGSHVPLIGELTADSLEENAYSFLAIN